MRLPNSDLPAMPVDTAQLYESRTDKGSWELASLGLTKREYFAGLAMQGLASSAAEYSRFYEMAKDALAMADALLVELERTK